MASAAGPRIETDGLVFALDAKNTKTFDDIPGITDHGISDWYCFTTGTVTYSAIYPNTEIIEIDTDGNEVGIVTTGSDPQRGQNLSITAGRRYYGTKAIHILQNGVNDAIAPVSFAGTYFGNIHTRYDPKTMKIYAPQDDINVSVYENVTGGVTGTATSTFSVSRGSSATFVTTQGNNVYTFFKTDKPAIMTVGSAGDDHVMMPMTNYVYRRRNHHERTINNTAPSNPSNTYVAYDTSLPLFTLEIADGSGGDSTQGIGYEYLSDTFSWGNVLSDYQIVAPYSDTTVTVSYWQNSQWNVGEVHSLSGTQTSPAAVDRDGTNGFGVDGSTISGAAANLASGANLWKWESTKPIAVIINDTGDDEENLLGWMSNNHLRTSSNSTQSFVNLIDKGRRRMKMRGKRLTTSSSYADAKLSAGDSITFDGVDDHIIINDNFNDPQQFTIEFWAYPTQLNFDSNNNYRRIFIPSGASTNGEHSVLIEQGGNISFRVPGGTTNNMQGSGYSGTNEWGYVVCTYDQSNKKIYFNGSLKNTVAESGVTVDFGSPQIVDPNGQTFKGNISNFKIYNRALTASEISQNFNALRGRFGL
jgi:hypothetical protein